MTNEKKYEAALKFQDQVYEYFAKEWGWNLTHYTSIENQYEFGENKQGIEIKHDQKFAKTGNLYLAVKRTYPYQEDMASGIMKQHNKRFFVIGNESKFYIFSLNKLRRYYEANTPYLYKGFVSGGRGTEWGFLLSQEVADEMAFETYTAQSTMQL